MNPLFGTLRCGAATLGARTACALLLLLACVAATAATTWRTDPSASHLGFKATQAGAEFEGRFKHFDAQICFDPADLPGSRFLVKIDTKSADTQDGERDATLASGDFFATDRWPTARFETTGFTAKGGGQFDVRGRLTIRDVTRDITLPIRFSAAAGGKQATLSGGTSIRRLDFGVGQGEWTDTTWVGNEVRIQFELKLMPVPKAP
jgi:polyisoprenoid-binding protein YceI